MSTAAGTQPFTFQLHESKFPFVSLIEFFRSKIPLLVAHVNGLSARLIQQAELRRNFSCVCVWSPKCLRLGKKLFRQSCVDTGNFWRRFTVCLFSYVVYSYF